MSEQRHTPGPWISLFEIDGDYFGARMETCQGGIEERQREAAACSDCNATAIAIPLHQALAAPDLLDACKLLLGSLDRLHGESSPDPFGRIGLEKLDKARAAIAKAEARPVDGRRCCPACGASLPQDGSCCDACEWVSP